jgi:uncharacterized protein with FMN-binding domain
MKKKKRKGLKIFLIVVGILAVVVIGFMSFLLVGQQGLKDAIIQNVDVSKLADGTYEGETTGSRFANKLEVTVSGGKITDIKIVKDMVVSLPDAQRVLSQVIDKQSLQVDTVSGATVSSKAYLKSIENALTKK